MQNCFKLSSEVQPVLYTSVQLVFSDTILDVLQFWKVQQAKVLDLKTLLDKLFSQILGEQGLQETGKFSWGNESCPF